VKFVVLILPLFLSLKVVAQTLNVSDISGYWVSTGVLCTSFSNPTFMESRFRSFRCEFNPLAMDDTCETERSLFIKPDESMLTLQYRDYDFDLVDSKASAPPMLVMRHSNSDIAGTIFYDQSANVLIRNLLHPDDPRLSISDELCNFTVFERRQLLF
jgi:hypothetical protein